MERERQTDSDLAVYKSGESPGFSLTWFHHLQTGELVFSHRIRVRIYFLSLIKEAKVNRGVDGDH